MYRICIDRTRPNSTVKKLEKEFPETVINVYDITGTKKHRIEILSVKDIRKEVHKLLKK